MRNRMLVLGLMLAMLAQVALAQTHKITLVNKTGYAIKALYIAPASDADFDKSDELLEGEKFANGETLEITYTGNAKVWDLLVTWSDGSGDSEWSKITLVPGGKYAIVYSRDSDETSIRKL